MVKGLISLLKIAYLILGTPNPKSFSNNIETSAYKHRSNLEAIENDSGSCPCVTRVKGPFQYEYFALSLLLRKCL